MEKTLQEFKEKTGFTIEMAIVKAFSRTNKIPSESQVEIIKNEIFDEYKNVDQQMIFKALKNGGRGKYGRTYNLSSQEICIWIDSYLKENITKDEQIRKAVERMKKENKRPI